MDEIDVLSLSVLRDFQQIEHSEKTRCLCQLRRDIRKPDWRDRIDFDLPFFHRISSAGFHVEPFPDTDAARDFSSTNSLSQTLGEKHAVLICSASHLKVARMPTVL